MSFGARIYNGDGREIVGNSNNLFPLEIISPVSSSGSRTYSLSGTERLVVTIQHGQIGAWPTLTGIRVSGNTVSWSAGMAGIDGYSSQVYLFISKTGV